MADTEQATNKIPLFRGNSKDTISVEAWCRAVDRYAEKQGWRDGDLHKKGAAVALDMLREAANEWAENLLEAKPDTYNNWIALKAAIIERFSPHRNAAQRVKAITLLQQRANEPVGEFFDRVETAVRVTNKPVLEAVPEGNAKKDTIKGIRLAMDTFHKNLFVAGLRPEIRKPVERSMEDEDTPTDVLKCAQRAESTEGLAKNVGIAAINADGAAAFPGHASQTSGLLSNDDLKAEIAALTTRLNQFTGGAKGKKANTPGTPRPPFGQRQWTFCFKCKQWGVHVQSECRLSTEELSRLTPQKRSDKPSGPPRDKQYPN